MDKKQINALHRQAVKFTYSGKLYNAMSLIKRQAAENQLGIFPALNSAQETYSLMLKYSAQGISDSNRDNIFNDLQLTLLKSADNLKNSLLKKFYSSEFFSLKTSPMPIEPPEKSSISQWFKYLVNNEELSPEAENLIRAQDTEKKLAWVYTSMIISALTLSCLLFFDFRKFNMLVDFYLENKEQVWQRALAGIVIISYRFNKRLNFYPEIPELLKKLTDSPNFKERYQTIIIQLIKAINTDRISKVVNDKIMPEINKMVPGIKDKMKSDAFNIENFDESNPAWGDYFQKNPELLDKMSEISKLQMEGSDVFINTFAVLKNFKFFDSIENWFMPFYPENQYVKEVTKTTETSGFNFKEFALKFSKVPFFCNSDKYSMIFSVSNMPKDQSNTLNSYFSNELSQMNEITDDMKLLHSKEYSYKLMTQYIQDIYRFFKLNRTGNIFPDIFDKNFSPIGTRLFDSTLSSASDKRTVGEYFFANEYYPQAVEFFQAVSKEEPDFELFQKMGYAYQKLSDYQSALDCFLKAQLFNDSQLWNLKKIAYCYRKLDNPGKALEFYKLAEVQDSDNLSVATSIGRCLLELENYQEALKYYFKVEYLDVKNKKIFRPIAWCCYQLKKYEQALKYFSKIPKEDSLAEDFVLAGHTLRKLGDNEKAYENYVKALNFEGYTVEKLEDAIKADYNEDSSEETLKQTNMILDYLLFRKDGNF
ncbi:MAG: hypothetical protein IIU11_05200 [Bacteroidales bacterium]|nr:hypothetical protein [Bacteroidales bacterium]MBR6278629.1 hypothetical protein [Bacteroidales bacterium]